jgi:hypothetical protein
MSGVVIQQSGPSIGLESQAPLGNVPCTRDIPIFYSRGLSERVREVFTGAIRKGEIL